MIRNILWDIDGTLFDTYPAMVAAFGKALSELGVWLEPAAIDGLVRVSMDHCLDTLSQRFALDRDLLEKRFGEHYRATPPEDQPVFAGAAEVCAHIQGRGGLNIAITHRRVQSTRRLLEAHGLVTHFAGVLSAEQGYARKPDPALVLAAVQQHRLNPAETLMLGDRELDIQAGRAGGTLTCLFGREKLSAPADYQIDNFWQLLDILQGPPGS